MRTTIHFLLSAALCLAPCGAALAGDVASGTGWSLSEEGVLTVGADYAWANPEWDYQYQTPCQDAWSANADDVKSVVVAEGVESIGARAFSQCKNLTSVSLPEGLKSIGYCAFVTCSSLGSIDIPTSVTEIGQYAFGECKSLKSIALPKGLTAISDYTLWNCFGLESVDIPSGVTEIGKSAFSGCTSLKGVDLPDGITMIKDYTFSHCSSLRSVSLPKELTSIGQYAFEKCSSLVSIEIPAEVSLIDRGAFSECGSLCQVIMRSSAPPYYGSSFDEDVTLIVPAEAVEDYKAADLEQEYAVTYAKAEGDGWVLTAAGDLTVNESYEWKGTAAGECAEAWKDCSADVLSVDLFEGVTQVAPGAFSGFAALESVGLAASVTDVGAGAFGGCYALVSVLSPATAPPSLGEGAFAGMIDDLTVAWASVDAYEASDWGMYFTTVSSSVDGGEGWSLSIDGVLEIDADYVWADGPSPWEENGEGVKDIVLTEGVKEVGDFAFSSCYNVLSVSLPESLEKIGESAFNDCYYLSLVTCRATTPPALGEEAFWEMDCPLYVPAQAVEAYKASDWERYFGEILAIATPPVTAVADIEDADGAAVRVADGVVTVGGEPARVFSLQGRMMPAGRPLGKGLYVVATPRGAVKVAVK